MKEYDFTLKYRLASPDEDAAKHIEALAECGCEDAVVGIGQSGRISLNFVREADSALNAVTSAIADVRKAIPDAKLVEAGPDYVGVTDIAELMGFSRQYMRKLIEASGAGFPEPVHEGKPTLWHLADILTWFRDHEIRRIVDELFDVSRVNMQLNLYKSCIRVSQTAGTGFEFKVRAPTRKLQGALLAATRT